MAILEPIILPSLGNPSVAVLPRRGKNLTDQDFYQQQQEAGNPVDNTVKPPQSQFASDPQTGNLIAASIQRLAQRKAPPMLEPGSRVQNPTQAQPDDFKSYYDALGYINQANQAATGAAESRAAYQRQQQLAALANQQVAGFNMPTLQGGGGGSYGGSIPSNPAANFKFAQQLAPQFGWTGKELNAWYTLGMKESGWRNTAQNPTSTAYGIGQFLNSTWAGVGMAKTSDPYSQVLAMAKYIKNRYGSPSAALAFHISHNWY